MVYGDSIEESETQLKKALIEILESYPNEELDDLSFPPLMSGLNICFSIFLMSSSLIIVF